MRLLVRPAHQHLVRVLAGALLCVAVLDADAYPPYRAGRGGYHGAIAYHQPTGSIGYSYDFKKPRDAKVAALGQCADAGCEVVVSIHNACGALVGTNGTKFYTAVGATRQEAELRANNKCAGDKRRDCKPLAWSCTR